MQKTQIKEKYAYSPTLNTVLMVENTMKNMDESAFSLAKLKKELPKQVNHNMLKIIIDYLEDSNKIVFHQKALLGHKTKIKN